MKNVLILLLILCLNDVYTQIKTPDFNGIWNETSDTNYYRIFKDGKYLDLYLSKNSNKIYLTSAIYGFCDERYKNGLMSDSLEEQNYVSNYILKTEQNDKNRFLALKYINKDIFTYEIEFTEFEFTLFGQKVFTYSKIQKLPPNIETRLREECKKKNIDIDYFLGPPKKQTVINTPKSPLYKTPNVPTKMYLIKGDPVEVLEQKESWLKIRYYGKKTIEGWIKKEDVEK